MPAKTEKSKVLHSFKVCFNVLTTTKHEPVANILDNNAQIYVFFHIPDNFQGVTEVVFDRLPKSLRVDISQENSIKFYGR